MADHSGYAFPCFVPHWMYRNDADRIGHTEYVPEGGMLLRDYFAGQALAGLIRNEHDDTIWRVPPAEYARCAYVMADAMLKAREVNPHGV